MTLDADALLNHVKSSLPGMTIKAEITDKMTPCWRHTKGRVLKKWRVPFTGVKDTGIKEQISLRAA